MPPYLEETYPCLVWHRRRGRMPPYLEETYPCLVWIVFWVLMQKVVWWCLAGHQMEVC